jgi:hypothetical protein
MKILFSEFHHRTNLTAPLLSNGQLASKKKILAYFIRFGKRKNFVEVFFSIRALFRRENSI